MNKLIASVVACFLLLQLEAQNTKPVASKPAEKKLETNVPVAEGGDALGLKEIEFDFGKIPQGKPVTHVFEVVNNSSDSLKISNVQASCGCTTPDWEKDKVFAPGQKTQITVGYNAASEGPFTKFITISYNGTQNKQITIKGEVWKTPVTSAPENNSLNNLKEQ